VVGDAWIFVVFEEQVVELVEEKDVLGFGFWD
jgi:hypothetical protein